MSTPTVLLMTSVIPLNAKTRKSSELSKLKFIHETITNDVKEVTKGDVNKIPDEPTAIETLNFLKDFTNARTTYKWTQGPKLFANFHSLISDCIIAEEVWDEEVAKTTTETVASFTAAYNNFKDSMLQELRYDDQVEYLRNLKKPDSMPVREFLQRLKTLNVLSRRFPDAPPTDPGLTDFELKRCFHHAMPVAWQRNFTIAGKKYTTESLSDIYTYMMTQEQADSLTTPTVPSPPIAKSHGPSTRNVRNGASNTNTSPSNQGGSVHKIKPSDPCPLPTHQNHIWYRCNQNRHGIHGDDTRRPISSEYSTTPQHVTSNPPAESNMIEPAETNYVHFEDQDDDFTFPDGESEHDS